MFSSVLKWFFVLALAAFFGAVMAQAEPTLNQVYEAAQSGHVDRAQEMMKQVLTAHPKSGKAHYVQAELYARQKQFSQARQELASAESFAPGLPFAKPDAVRALRNEISAASTSSPSAGAGALSGMTDFRNSNRAPAAVAPAPAEPSRSSFPWGLVLAIAAGAGALMFFLRRRPAPAPVASGSYAASPTGMQPAPYGTQPAPYGNAPYGAAPSPAPAAPGMGGNLMGGLATGLAVGAGVVAAGELGRRFFGSENHPNPAAQPAEPRAPIEPDYNRDMGGNDFGIRDADAGSWDDGGSSSDGGGWDS